MNGVLFDKAQVKLLQFPIGLGGSYTIPNGVSTIGDAAFNNCTNLMAVTITNSVTTIGYAAFGGCSKLTSLIIPSSVTSIADYAFKDSASIKTVTIGNQLASIGNYAFFVCTNLTSAYFQGNAPATNGNAFYADPAIVYYLSGTSGWGSTFGGVPTMLWNPQPDNAGFTGGKFGFNLTGPANAVVVVQACTNLTNPVWLPVGTNTFSSASKTTFSDAKSGSYRSRYYRVLVP